MSAHEVAERQVSLNLRRSDLEGVDLVRSGAVAIVFSEVTTATNAKLSHRFVTQRLQSVSYTHLTLPTTPYV